MPDLGSDLGLQLQTGGQTRNVPSWRDVKERPLARIRGLNAGEVLPPYTELASLFGCSLGSVKQAMRELAAEGWISVKRGRQARALWTGSSSGSSCRAGHQLLTRAFHTAYRPLEETEGPIARELGLPQGQSCIVCGRVRLIDSRAATISVPI